MELPKVSELIFDNKNANLEKLKSIFPEAVKDGCIDWELLHQIFEGVEESIEKYQLSWAGKHKAIEEANGDSIGNTLSFIEKYGSKEETDNLFIEGDNLTVLKLLRNNYYNSIKMIYIDPPYNTGGDLIYKDDYSLDIKTQDELDGNLIGEEKLILNQRNSSRYHTEWLNMMYPRLKIAKDLLSDDGVIFISIDDNEVDNLKKVCDEIFGENNFLNLVSVNSKVSAGASGGGEDKKLKKNIEYLLIYVKNLSSIEPFNSIYNQTELMKYINEMKENKKSFKYTNVLYKTGEYSYEKTIQDGDGNDIEIYKVNGYEIKTVKQVAALENLTEKEVYYKYYDKIMTTTNAQTSIRTRVWEATDSENNMYAARYIPRSGKNKGEKIEILLMGKQKVYVIWLKDTTTTINGVIYKREKVGTYWDGLSWINVTKEGNVKYPNGKKPIAFIHRMMDLIETSNDYTVLDFFAGSASTGHAVLEKNLLDQGKRKFILVQVPEVIKPDSKERKEYIKYLESERIEPVITEVGKERLKRAINKIEDTLESVNLDTGFKVFKVDETHIRWTHEALAEGQITADEAEMTDKDKLDFMPGTKDIDVVYEVMLRQRDVPLSSSIELLSHIGERTYMFADSYVVCLEEDITEELIEKLAAIDPLPIKYVLRDSAFGDNISLKEETFRRLQLLVERNTGVSKKTYTVEFL